MIGHRRQLMVAATWALALAMAGGAAVPAGAQAPVIKGYRVFQMYQDRFTFQYPSKDWIAIPGGGASLLTLTQKKQEATVTVEFHPLQLELAPAEIDQNFAQIEAEPLGLHQPTASGMKAEVVDSDGRRIVVINFTRRGVLGAEQVRQYSIPIGKQLYRIVCAAPAAQFGKYEPVFANVVRTFTVAGAPPAAAPSKS